VKISQKVLGGLLLLTRTAHAAAGDTFVYWLLRLFDDIMSQCGVKTKETAWTTCSAVYTWPITDLNEPLLLKKW